MYIRDFAGRGASVRGLIEAYGAGAPVHAALLLGPEGVGKRTLAGLLAQSLYCTGPEPKPCGVCPGCRRFLVGSHPDAYRILAQKSIGVDAIRELIASLAAAAYEGGWRSVIIEGAGTMTTQAQNSLLKTLEEPPEKTVFLLTAGSLAQLLPTVRSRCQLVQVPPMTNGEVAKALEGRGLSAERAALLARLSRGSVGAALAIDGDASFWALRDKVHAALAAVKRPADVLVAIAAFKDDKADAQRVVGLIEDALRDALAACLAGQRTGEEGWARALSALDARTLTSLLEQVFQMRRMLASNVAWQAVWERFLLEYAGALAG